MTFDFIPWFLHSIYVTIFSCDMLSTLFLENISFLCHCITTLLIENISFLCNHLKPSYVMTFNVIPGFFSFSNVTKNNIDIRPGPPKKLEQRRRTFSMLIFLGVEKVVDVNHLRPLMLIFSLLVPLPRKNHIKHKMVSTTRKKT